MRLRSVAVAVIGALALASPASSQDDAPQVSAGLAYDGDSRSRLVLSFSVGGSVGVGRLQIILKQPAGAMTVAGSSPAASCSTFMAGDTPGANCDFPGGVAPGTNGTVTVDLPGPYPVNGGAEVRAYPSGAGAGSGPVDAAGPAEPSSGGGGGQTESKSADLNVEVRMTAIPDKQAGGFDLGREARTAFGVPAGATDLVTFGAVTVVTNRGPDPAESLTIRVDPPTLPETSGERWNAGHDCPAKEFRYQGILTPATLTCGPLAPSAADVPAHQLPKTSAEIVTAAFVVWGPGAIGVHASASSATRDPGPSPNEATGAVTFVSLPDASRIARGTFGGDTSLGGRGSGASAVELAIRVLLPGARTAAGGCRWLKRPGGGSVRDPGACDAPRWMKAKGAKRWRIALPELPDGRYVAYARARRGPLKEASFDRRDGNMLSFRVG